jgi:hypothetical protein
VFHADDWLSTLILDLKRPVLDIALDFRIVALASNKTFSIEDGVFGIGMEGVFSGVTDPKTPLNTETRGKSLTQKTRTFAHHP